MLRFLYTLCGWMLLSSAVHAQEANPYVWVQLDAPSAGTTLTAPASILVSASAGTIDDGVSVSSITLYQNGGVIASVNGQESVSLSSMEHRPAHISSQHAPPAILGNRDDPDNCGHGRGCGDNPPSISLNDANGAPFLRRPR
ncbi:Ig-like domain-containing protein [Xanthomonas euroxanthea]